MTTGAPLSAEHERAWRTYLRAHALLERQLDAELRSECGLTLKVYDALVQLSELPERRARMKDLAAALVYSQSGLTRVVDGMERDGLVRREVDPADRRAMQVVLTRAGQRALERAWPVHLRGVNEYWAQHLTTAQAQAIAKGFGKVRDRLD